MGIKIANSFSGDPLLLNKKQNFFFCGGRDTWQILEKLKNLLPMFQISTGEFPDDEGMSQDQSRIEKVLKDRISLAQMIDPDRSIDKIHAATPDGLADVGEWTLVGARSLPKERAASHFPARSKP